MNFREKYTLDERIAESGRTLAKYPDRVPIIVQKKANCDLADLEKSKYLVPVDMTLGQFVYVIRRRIRLESAKALFVFVDGGVLPPTAASMLSLYSKYAYKDGFMYVTYSGENTFGGRGG